MWRIWKTDLYRNTLILNWIAIFLIFISHLRFNFFSELQRFSLISRLFFPTFTSFSFQPSQFRFTVFSIIHHSLLIFFELLDRSLWFYHLHVALWLKFAVLYFSSLIFLTFFTILFSSDLFFLDFLLSSLPILPRRFRFLPSICVWCHRPLLPYSWFLEFSYYRLAGDGDWVHLCWFRFWKKRQMLKRRPNRVTQ